jgi:prolipoprotein diacylglyceryltransferase
MYPDLSYLFSDLLGTEQDNWLSIFKTFGLLLALALLGAGVVLKSELRRRERAGMISPIQQIIERKSGIEWSAVVTNAIIGLALGMKAPYIRQHFSEFQADPAAVLFSSKGNILLGLVGAVILGGIVYWQESKKNVKPGKFEETIYPHTKAADITILAGISGVVGAKLFSILENLESFFADPMGTIFSGSGLTIYGGLILATIVVYRYIKKLGIPVGQMFDIAGMAILVGYAVGRLGCHFSGDGDWGIVAAAQPDWWFLPDWTWSYAYPNNVANDGILLEACDPDKWSELASQRMRVEDRCAEACGMRYCHTMSDAPVYPTSIWETTASLLMFAFLWLIRKRVQVVGVLFSLYLIFQGVERWTVETVRVNEKYDYFGVHWSQAQYISVVISVIGIGLLIYLTRGGRRQKA